MIQRIQHLFLLIIAVSNIIFLFVNIWQASNAQEAFVTLNCLQLTVTRSGNVITQYNTAWIAGLAIVVFAASIVSIISFKNRLRQIQIGLVISVLLSAILGGIVYYTFKAKDLAVDMNNGTFGIGLIIPAFSLLLNNLSNRFIRKDEELVRSADRLR